MTAGTEPLTERPAWKALKAHYTLGPPSESSLPMLAPRTINRWNAPPKVRFATDSPLEEGVSSEPVSGARPRGQAIDPVKPGGRGEGGRKNGGSTPCTSSHRREKYV